YANHLANCPFFTDGSCGACIQRCPAGAISAQGHDKIKCREEMYGVQKAWLEKPGYIGNYAGCGLCQTKVPCESRIPRAAQ
ncbi:MAG: epoxyqueuosine reductase, partial [Dehalococcoidia bacterium]|nr:epoxyqueuosine reductase [Dehalococcoidia bacterium]